MSKLALRAFQTLLIINMVFLTGCNWHVLTNQTTSTQIDQLPRSTQEYRFESMKVSLQVPKNWEIKDGQTGARFISSEGEISLGHNSTNWDSFKDFLGGQDRGRTTLTVSQENQSPLPLYESNSRIETFKRDVVIENKVFYIFIDNEIFFLSTETPSLYDDLDQFAHSFRYYGK